MDKCCQGLEVEVEEINTNSYRLTKDGFYFLDYFPGTNKSCLFPGHNKTWVQVNNLIEYLCSCFDDEIGYLVRQKHPDKNLKPRECNW